MYSSKFKAVGKSYSEAMTRYVPKSEIADDWHENVVPAIREMTGTTIPAPKEDKILKRTAHICKDDPKMIEHTWVAEAAEVLDLDYQRLESLVALKRS